MAKLPSTFPKTIGSVSRGRVDVSRLSKRQAIELTKHQWAWMRDNTASKGDYVFHFDVDVGCWACRYDSQKGGTCDKCPVWITEVKCVDDQSSYAPYQHSLGKDTDVPKDILEKAANGIIALCDKRLVELGASSGVADHETG